MTNKMSVEEIAKTVKAKSYYLSSLSSEDRNKMLYVIADELLHSTNDILLANKKDLDNLQGKDNAFIDRLTLTKERVAQMAQGVKEVALLDDPIGDVVDEWSRDERLLNIKKVRAPLGVIGVIYEARPNVTVDVVALCIKSANSVILRGGADALNSNTFLFHVIKSALEKNGFDSNILGFIESKDRLATLELLKQNKYIDLIIPRGGEGLKKLVLEHSTIPIIASAGGNCHCYIDSNFNIQYAKDIVFNAKMQRPTVCNALEQLVVHVDVLPYLKEILEPLYEKGCILKGDERSVKAYSKIEKCDESEYYDEHLSYYLTIKTVDDIDMAITHINEHSTSHSECIISNIDSNIEKFYRMVDSGAVYANASTRFTDGFEFGFGAEIAISTQKLHARGPLGLKQLTCEKYIIKGEGSIRK